MESNNTEVQGSNPSSLTPATAQEIREAELLSSQDEAKTILGFDLESYTEMDLLTHYQKLVIPKIEDPELEKKEQHLIKQIIDAKNILQRLKVEKQLEENGKFGLEFPFEEIDSRCTICPSCNGYGERFEFFPKIVEVPCKFCKNGEVIITCPACRGTGRYNRDLGNVKIKVACKKCHKVNEKDENVPVVSDEKTGEPLVGKIKVKCRVCRGSGKFRKIVLDSFIKTTTYCKHCKGRGFHLNRTQPDNPVIPQEIGKVIKNAVASE